MKVVRLEQDNGYGPYYGGLYEIAIQCHDNVRSPIPDHDGITAHSMGYHFGFLSVQQMLDWFDSHIIEELVEHGINIFEYEVEAEWVQFGGKQLVFDRDHATVVRTLELDEVLAA